MSAPLLVVHLKPSRHLAVILGIAHVATAGLLWPLALPAAVKMAGAAVLAISLAFYLRHYALLRSPGAVISFELSDEMVCTLETRRGERMVCELLGSSFVAPYLTVLNLKPAEGFFTRSVVILADAIDAEEFRQLRVLLRWKWQEPS